MNKVVEAEIVDTRISEKETKSVALFEMGEVKKFLKRAGLRSVNTIPKDVELEIKFTGDGFKMGTYPVPEGGKTIEREGLMTKAIITYAPEASHLIFGVEYLLCLSKNGIIGLGNYNNAHGGNHNLKDRTFKVFNKNNKTYIWTEVMTEEKTNEGTEQQI